MLLRTAQLFAILVALAGLAPAQVSYDVGYFDHLDKRSETTGLDTLMRAQRAANAHSFELGSANLDLQSWDMLVLGSYSERSDDWEGFVARHSTRIFDWVRKGGLLVIMARWRGSDTGKEYGRTELLPKGFWVVRSDKSNKEVEVCVDLLPLWRGIHDNEKEYRGQTWYRRPSGSYGDVDRGVVDAFEDWSTQFTKSAVRNRKRPDRYAFALHAPYGRGQILLFQLAWDKVDGAEDELSRVLGRDFLDCALRYGKARPNPGKIRKRATPRERPERREEPRKPERREPVEVDPGPEEVPEPPRPPARLRIQGRIFLDTDGDGRFDRGEPPVEDVAVRGIEEAAATDRNGLYSLVRDRDASGYLQVDLPAGHVCRGSWFLDLKGDTVRDAIHVHDFPLVKREDAVERVVCAAIPPGLTDPALAASFESRLLVLARRENAARLILVAADADSLKAMRPRLAALLEGDLGFSLYVVRPTITAARDGLGPANWRFHGAGRLFLADPSILPKDEIGPVVLVGGAASAAQRFVEAGKQRQAITAEAVPEDSAVLDLPMLLDPENETAPSSYLVFELAPEGASMRIEPRPGSAAPDLPVHPWGRGDIGSLLEEEGAPSGR